MTRQVEHQAMVARLESPRSIPLAVLQDETTIRLLHAAMGCVTEAGEFMDQMKRVTMYGKPIDKVNIIEELGDILWYVNLAINVLGITKEDVLEANLRKLQTRYPDKFTTEQALNRDADAERKALESK